jgi:putative membrane protein
MLSLAAEEVGRVTWHPHPDVWLLIALLIGGYMWALSSLGPKYAAGEEPATRSQKLWFFGGVFILWIAADAPIHDISEDYLFSVHMAQHTLFSLVAPPMLLLGIPRWLYRVMLPPRVLAVIHRITKPLLALLLFNLVVVVTHAPPLVNLSVRSEPAHFLLHSTLFLSAAIMWLPVVQPFPMTARLTDPGKMLYLFGQSILPTVPASFLTFAQEPIFSSYASFPRLWGISAETDQMVAGLLMKIGGGLLLWAVIAVIFFKWHAREERGTAESVSWDDFEHELQAWKLRRT